MRPGPLSEQYAARSSSSASGRATRSCLTLRAVRVPGRLRPGPPRRPARRRGVRHRGRRAPAPPRATRRGMALAMRRGPDDGSVGYDRVAAALVEEARAGRPPAFLTEGDPMLFGTGSYVAERLADPAPDVPVEVVPGVARRVGRGGEAGLAARAEGGDPDGLPGDVSCRRDRRHPRPRRARLLAQGGRRPARAGRGIAAAGRLDRAV